MNNLYYTDVYDTWASKVHKHEASNKVGENQRFIDMDCFKTLSNFMYAPAAIINGTTYIAQTIVFNDEQSVVDFILNTPKFKLFRCMYVSTIEDSWFILRGSY